MHSFHMQGFFFFPENDRIIINMPQDMIPPITVWRSDRSLTLQQIFDLLLSKQEQLSCGTFSHGCLAPWPLARSEEEPLLPPPLEEHPSHNLSPEIGSNGPTDRR